MFTQGDYYSAYTFFVRSCNSSSLALQRSQKGQAITDYIQILNAKTGHCMTWELYGQISNITFTPCIHTPDTPAQLFAATQYTYQEYADASMGLVADGDWSFVITPDGHVGVGQDAIDGTPVNGTYHATTRK